MMGLFSFLFGRKRVSAPETVEIEGPVSGVSESEVVVIEKHNPNPFGRGAPSSAPPPDAAGMYRIVSRDDGSILYIGVSKSIRRRLGEHRRFGKYVETLHTFKWQLLRDGASLEDLYSHERRKVAKHRPTNNIRAGGGGRR